VSPSRRLLIGAVLAVLAPALAACGDGGLDVALCTTTKRVVAKTVPELEKRFDLVELTYGCDPVETVFDGVRIAIAGTTDYPSRAQLADAVRTRLESAGWTARAGSRELTLRQSGKSFTANVAIHSTAPALAFVALANDHPSLATGIRKVKGAVAERHLTGAQRLRYLTFRAFVPRVVPAGYRAWTGAEVLDEFDDTQSSLVGGRGIELILQSRPLPSDYTTRNCEAAPGPPPLKGCVLWATTPAGTKVYLASDSSAPDGLEDTPIAVVDGTLAELVYGHGHPDVKPAISKADVLRIFDSLRSRNTPAKR
jgi:hypothetical protein